MAADLLNITDATFDSEVIRSPLPVLVDFWAVWCVPCKAIAPVLEKLAAEYEGKLRVVRLNVEENRDIPAKFGIRGVPTLLLLKGGEVKETLIGAVPKDKIVRAVAKHL